MWWRPPDARPPGLVLVRGPPGGGGPANWAREGRHEYGRARRGRARASGKRTAKNKQVSDRVLQHTRQKKIEGAHRIVSLFFPHPAMQASLMATTRCVCEHACTHARVARRARARGRCGRADGVRASESGRLARRRPPCIFPRSPPAPLPVTAARSHAPRPAVTALPLSYTFRGWHAGVATAPPRPPPRRGRPRPSSSHLASPPPLSPLP